MGLEQKHKPNKSKLKLDDVKISTKGMNPDYANHKLDSTKNIPTIYYYNTELNPQSVSKLIIDSNKYMPLLYLCYDDVMNIMEDFGFPTDNTNVTVVLPTNHEVFGNIFMNFKIQKYNVEISRTSTNKKIHMWGICNVDGMLISSYKAYDKKTSYNIIQEISQDVGLGFVSNVNSSNDNMTWLNPGMNVYNFLQDMSNNAWVGESGFVWSFVDVFYNINYIDIEKSLSQDISEIKWINTNQLNNKILPNGKEDANITPPVLTNEASMRGSNTYFTGEKILNQSTDISLKRGYIRNVNFYDVDGNWSEKGGSYNSYGLDTITSSNTETNAIYLKGNPGDTEFYKNNNKNHYLDKIDTINAYPDYLWAKLQNSENLFDLQKIAVEIKLPVPNYNIRRFEKVKLIFTSGKIGAKSIQRNIKLNGEWLVIGQSFHWNGNAIYQKINLVKRELTIDEV